MPRSGAAVVVSCFTGARGNTRENVLLFRAGDQTGRAETEENGALKIGGESGQDRDESRCGVKIDSESRKVDLGTDIIFQNFRRPRADATRDSCDVLYDPTPCFIPARARARLTNSPLHPSRDPPRRSAVLLAFALDASRRTECSALRTAI